jgi:integrase
MAVKVKEKVKGSGVYWVFANLNYQRKSWMIGGKKSAESFAEDVRKSILLDGKLETKKASAIPTLEQYYKEFSDAYLTGQSEATQKNYDFSFRLHIVPKLGSIPIDQISRRCVKSFIADLRKKVITRGKKKKVTKLLSKATIRIFVADLCTLFNHAI